jgi:hypothetical protein
VRPKRVCGRPLQLASAPLIIDLSQNVLGLGAGRSRGQARTRVCQSDYNTGYLSFLLFALLHSPLVLIETLHTHAASVCVRVCCYLCILQCGRGLIDLPTRDSNPALYCSFVLFAECQSTYICAHST